jgi:isocitrate dehydrogenase
VTLVHKGNIIEFPEGSFRRWGYEVGREEFAKATVKCSEFADAAVARRRRRREQEGDGTWDARRSL